MADECHFIWHLYLGCRGSILVRLLDWDSFTSLAIALASSFPLVDINKALLSLPASLLCGILNLKQEQL